MKPEVSAAVVVPSTNATWRIVPAVAFSFVAYLAIGLPLAILPAFVHLRMGIGTVLAGSIISLQYVATFLSRPKAGRMSDTIGPKQTVRTGLWACCLSGLFILVASFLVAEPWAALACLAASRLALGIGESLCATGATMWAIGRVGSKHTGQVISLNGVATYGALAVGAPIGVALEASGGFGLVGGLIMLVSLLSFGLASRMAPTATVAGEQMPTAKIIRSVTPYGLGLALAGMGFGVIATFITLFFASQNWGGAALCLTIFGLVFVSVRLLISNSISRFGGRKVALFSLGVEIAGLLLLMKAPSAPMAYLAVALIGSGFSPIFPALAVEAVKVFPPSVHGSVLGVYNAFVDGSLLLTGPFAGAVIEHWGYRPLFGVTAGAVGLAFGITMLLKRTAKDQS